MGRFVDSVIAIRILKLLTTPFEKTKAYELGIIDDKGKDLKKLLKEYQLKIKNFYHMQLH